MWCYLCHVKSSFLQESLISHLVTITSRDGYYFLANHCVLIESNNLEETDLQWHHLDQLVHMLHTGQLLHIRLVAKVIGVVLFVVHCWRALPALQQFKLSNLLFKRVCTQQKFSGRWRIAYAISGSGYRDIKFAQIAHTIRCRRSWGLFVRDREHSHLHAPYERVLSQRDRGLVQIQCWVVSRTICHNFKRLIVLGVNKYLKNNSQNPSALCKRDPKYNKIHANSLNHQASTLLKG